MNSGGSPCGAAVVADRAAAAAAAAAAADAVEGVALLLELGQHLLDRAAGHELHQHEVDEQDAEERRDDEQQPAEDVGAHQVSLASAQGPRGLQRVEARHVGPPDAGRPVANAGSSSGWR